MHLRPYQLEILSAVRNGWEEFDRQLVVSATGTGKTIVFSHMAKEAADAGERTLVLVDQSELAFQTVDKMKRAAGLACEVEKAEWRATMEAQAVVATVQTMSRRLEDWPRDHFGLIIADEADKSICAQWQKVIKHFDGDARVCGLTATPNRNDKRNLGEYYQNVAFDATLFDFIGNGKWAFDDNGRRDWLSPINVKMLPIAINLKGVHTKGGDYDSAQLHDAITPHLMEAALAIKHHASFRKVLVFVPLIATSQKFVEICRSVGLAAEHIDGTSEDRADKLKRYEAGEFDVLVNSALLLRGVDIPGIDCVVMLRPTKSITLYQQAIGRGTRLAEFKENLLLLDFLYQADKKIVCHPAHLIATTPEEADAITELTVKAPAMPGDVAEQMPMDLQGLATECQVQREAALKKKLEEHKDRKSKTISAEEFAIRHNDLAAAEFEPTMKWESEPVTEKQAKYLKKAGIDLDTVKGKGHATKLLALHFGSQPLTLAAPKAIALMCKMRHITNSIGITSPEHATAAEAGRFFAELNRRKKAV